MAAIDEDNRSPWLSILIPVYNVGAYVEDCLGSVLSQVDAGVEIIALDDCGTDDGWQKVERIAAQHPQQLRLLRHAGNRGLSAARNTLLSHARGRYVWFVDSDDMVAADAVPALHRIVETHAPDLVLCDFRVLRECDRPHHRLRRERHRRTFAGPASCLGEDRRRLAAGLLRSRQMHVWSKIATREAWQQAPFPEGRYFEDMAVLPALLQATRRWWHASFPWIAYRQRGDSIVARLDQKKTLDLLASLQDLRTGFRDADGGLDEDGAAWLDCFLLRTLAGIARKSPRDDAILERRVREAIDAMFPGSLAAAVAGSRKTVGWLRAWRVRRALARRGWLQ